MQADVILGLSGIRGRFAVGLVVDQRVVFAVEEDKLRRFRGPGFRPLEDAGSRAIDLALEKLDSGAKGITRIAYVPPLSASASQAATDVQLIEQFMASEYGVSPPVSTIDHVDSHLAFERAVHAGVDHVLMVGRNHAVFSPGRSLPRSTDVDFPIVQQVEQLAAFAGFSAVRIHHLENMARFGEPRFAGEIRSLLASNADRGAIEGQFHMVSGMERRRPSEALDQNHYDFAASLCSVLQSEIIALVGSIPEHERSGALAVCGGVFHSWSLNDALASAFPECRILTSFAPGNASGAIGGPLVLAGEPRGRAIGPFLGPEYTREEIKSVLDNAKVRYALNSAGETLSRVCRALEEGQMVGWFRGRCEFGYRALGSRSVFASPANPYACDNLSSYLKRRPAYFAYAVAVDQNDPVVEGIESPYLSRSVLLPDYFQDARVRVQSVSKEGAPALFQLLDEFRKRTGVSALLNTSLNYFDEPIACTPRDALKTFYASGLDMLVMEDFLLTKMEEFGSTRQ